MSPSGKKAFSRPTVVAIDRGLLPLSRACISYRSSASFRQLGYALERVLVIDDMPRCLERQRANLIPVLPVTGSAEDHELREMLPFLEPLRDMPNVRLVDKRGW